MIKINLIALTQAGIIACKIYIFIIMKKKILSCVFALALLATTGWGVNKSMSNDAGLRDLALANVAALAVTETIKIDCDQWYKEECVELEINRTKIILPGRKQ